MNAPVFYNEIDPFAASWLERLIADGHLPAGPVDRRDIRDICPDELAGYRQCHFFAGIGGWACALRLAGWPDDRPVWTGSCPCQPFSAAGRRGGTSDERHLWPAFFHLIDSRRPDVVLGEQVASKDGLAWLDLVHDDLEGAGYAVRAADLCAAGVGAPHIRQRLWFVAQGLDDADARQRLRLKHGAAGWDKSKYGREFVSMANSLGQRPEGRDARALGDERETVERSSTTSWLDNSKRNGRREVGNDHGRDVGLVADAASPWLDLKWLPCRDGKARPAQPRFQSVVDGLSAGMVPLCAESVKAVEEEINGTPCASIARETLLDVQQAFQQGAQCEWPIRGCDGVQGAAVLFAFLRQLAVQGWAYAPRLPKPSTQASSFDVRMLRGRQELGCASRGRRLDERQPVEFTDAMRVLSSVLAQHASAAWGETLNSDAAPLAPLAHAVPNRVGTLRGAGNAIVPQVAAEFIRATNELSVFTGERALMGNHQAESRTP